MVARPAASRTVESSQPRVIRAPSQISAAASDDYYSPPESANSSRSRITVIPYRTPPSRNVSPVSNTRHGAVSPVSTLEETQASTSVRQTQPAQNQQSSSKNVVGGQVAGNGSLAMGTDDSPYIQFAIDQITRDEGLPVPERQGSVVSEEYPVERIVADESFSRRPSDWRDRSKEEPDSSPRDSTASDILIPADPPGDCNNDCSALNFTPVPLRPLSLCALITACLAMIAALIFCDVWSRRRSGLWDYDGFGGSRYFLFQFLPQILAVFIIVWTFVVQAAVYRIAPLWAVARPQSKERILQNVPMLPRNFVLPDISYLRCGETFVGACLLTMWVTNLFAIPLQSCLFQVRFYGTFAEGGFRWTAVQGVAWTLVSLYVLLAVAFTALMVRFGWGTTGLMWDPVSIADMIPLIQRSNILPEFNGSEVSLHVERHIPSLSVRLGYWHDSTKSGIRYGIGREGNSLNQAHSRGSIGHSSDSVPPGDADVERQCLNGKGLFDKTLHSPFSRSRWAPWFLRDTFVVAWISAATVLTIAFVIVSFVKQPLLKGFVPLLPTLTSKSGFSSSNFLFSFIPSLIGTSLFLAWQPIDVYFRAIQSYADLASSDGALAETSLLVGYNSYLPFAVTFRALTARHYKVAHVSFVGIASSVLPVLAGGIFLARYYTLPDEIRISTYLPAYYTLMAFVILYALSVYIIWPRRKRYLPHPLVTYADVISFLYQSPLLADAVFREPKSKADLITRAVMPPPGESERPRYAFGIYHGRDGRDHLGIDRLSRSDKPETTPGAIKEGSR